MGFYLTIAAFLVAARLLWLVITWLRHTQNARRWNCGAIPHYPSGILGLKTLKEALKADKEFAIPRVSGERIKKLSAREGRYVETFSICQAGRDSIFTCDPKNVQALLATQFKDFELGQPRRNALLSLLGSGIFTADGEEWHRSRALLRPQFTRDQISDLDLEERHVQNAMQGIPIDATTGWSAPTNLQAIFFRLTIDSATEFLFGESVDSQLAAFSNGRIPQDSFSNNFDKGQWYAAQRGRFEKLYFLANNKESRAIDASVHAYVDRFVAAALEQQKNPEKLVEDANKPYVFLHGLASKTQDPIELRSQLLNILLAGRDTTASLLSWSFLVLARNPSLHARLRSEILSSFGSYSSPRDITFSSLKSARSLHHFLNEVLRLYPIVPGNRRVANKDTTIPRGGGPNGNDPVYVKKGQSVNYSVFLTHRRKDIWGADADEFKPERWEGRRVGWEYLPFNGGPRICIGQQFALTEAAYVVVRFLQRFKEVEIGGDDGGERFGMTLTMAPGVPVVCRLREDV